MANHFTRIVVILVFAGSAELVWKQTALAALVLLLCETNVVDVCNVKVTLYALQYGRRTCGRPRVPKSARSVLWWIQYERCRVQWVWSADGMDGRGGRRWWFLAVRWAWRATVVGAEGDSGDFGLCYGRGG